MDVLHVMPCVSRAYGGPTQSLIGYTKAARTASIDITVAAPKPSAEDEHWLREQLSRATFRLFGGLGSGAFSVTPALFRWLWQAGGTYDAVHTHGLFNPTSSGVARLVTARRWPLVLRPFGTLSRYTFQYRRSVLKRLYFRFVDRPNVQRANVLHFTTTVERDEASRLAIHPGTRSHVIPPPFRGDFVEAMRGAWGPTVLFLSRLHPVKNVTGLLEAWPLVLHSVPSAQLVIAGDGEKTYVQNLKQRVGHLNIESSVSFEGFVQGARKRTLLQEAHAFVLPSYHENFGIAALEAVAAGLPVVISPEVQLASFIEAHALGCVVGRDPAPLAEALVETLNDESLRRRCAEEGPQRVEEHFSPEVVGRQLRAMYEAVQA